MLDCCLTLDYELFGSGQGNVFTHMIEPTDRLLSLCEKAGIKLTIFFEVVEYWQLKQHWERGIFMGYTSDPCQAIKEQLVKAFQQGHDVQLHLHPQWIDAVYEDGAWKLNLEYWRLPEVPEQPTQKISMGLDQLIEKGKQTIEELLQLENPNYKCNIVRAGGYNVDPSQVLIKILKKHGFVADSSVYYGGKLNSELSRYDYTTLSTGIPYWFSSETSLLGQCNEGDGLLELPIFALKMRRTHKYDLVRVKSALKNRANAVAKFKNNSIKKSNVATLKYLFEKEALTWDFCLFSSRKMKRFLKRANRIRENSAYPFHPFVLVGHPKDFYYSDALVSLIRHSQKCGGRFLTLTEMVQRIGRETEKGGNRIKKNKQIIA